MGGCWSSPHALARSTLGALGALGWWQGEKVAEQELPPSYFFIFINFFFCWEKINVT